MLLTTAVLVGAQTQPSPQSTTGSGGPDLLRTFPAPVNLRVLPKDFTGRQVHEVMKQWAGSLGVRCDACHVEITESAEPNRQHHLDFSDDSKPMKAVARRMYTMTEEINRNYIAKVDGSGMPVTCGTCHRGLVSPEAFLPAGEQPPAQAPSSVKESR